MKSETPSSPDRERRLDEVVTAYLKAMEAGEYPQPAQWLERYADLAKELKSFFAAQEQVVGMAGPLSDREGQRSGSETVGLEGTSRANNLGTIRYFGDYELLEEIARGGMGVVFKAKQVSLHRVVALKRILKGQLAADADVRRFRQEAEAAANLDHPNIVPIYEVGEFEGEHYFSMKLIESFVNPGPVSHRDVAQRLAKVARAVHHAHLRGILHRDLKPGNILIDSTGEPHVADFGLAKKVDGDENATRSGAIVGTPAYMAPEQARAEKSLTTAVDVWSLGAILYEWLTSRPAFRGDDVVSTLLKVMNDDPVPPRSANLNVDPDLETICLKCLQKEPTNRYRSAEALAEDLERWQRGEPIEARSAGRLERSWRWCRRNPAVASLIVAVLVAMMLGTTVSTILAIHARLSEREARHQETEAKNEKLRADEKTLEADRQKDLAEKAAKEEAVARKRAEFQALRAESARHAIQIEQGMTAWEINDIARAERALDEMDPSFLDAWETRHLRSLCNLRIQTLRGHEHRIDAAAYSPDGKHIVSGGYDRTLRIWDAVTGKQNQVFKAHLWVTAVTFSPDSQRIVTGHGDGKVTLWDFQTDKKPIIFQAHKDKITGIAFSPNGDRLLTGSEDMTAKIWDAMSQKLLLAISAKERVWAVAFSKDGKRIATAEHYPESYIRDAKTGEILASLKSPFSSKCISFSPDGQQVVTAYADGVLKLWDAATGKEQAILIGHKEAVESVAFSPDGTKILSGSVDATLRLWDRKTGQALLVLKGSNDWIHTVAFHPDGKRFLGAGNDHAIRVWNLDPVQAKRTFPNPWALSMAISPDGRNILFGGDTLHDSIKVLDVQTGAPTLQARSHRMGINRAAFSPEGKHIFSLDKHHNEIKAWDAATGHEIRSMAGSAFSPDAKRVLFQAEKDLYIRDGETGKNLVRLETPFDSWYVAEFSPDGNTLLAGLPDHSVRRWDVRTGKEMPGFPQHASFITVLAFSADGRRFLSGSLDKTVLVGDASTGKVLHILKGHAQSVTGVAFSLDGKRILTASGDEIKGKHVGAWKVWNADTGQEILASREPLTTVTSLKFSPDGGRFLTGDRDGSLTEWDASTGRKLRTLKGDRIVSCVAYSSDGKHFLYGGDEAVVRVYESATGRELLGLGYYGRTMAVAYRPDGERFVTASQNGEVKGWDARTGQQLVAFRGHTGVVSGVAYFPDGKRILTGGWDGTFRIWNADTAEQLLLRNQGTDIEAIVLSPDGSKIATAGRDNAIKLWNAKSGDLLHALTGHKDTINAVAFSNDGRRLLSASRDYTIKVWDAEAGKEQFTLKGHTSWVHGVAFSRDDQRIVSGSRDTTVKIWDARTGQEKLTLRGHSASVQCVAFHPDEKRLISCSEDGTMKIWEAP